jgi:hypothetical protein
VIIKETNPDTSVSSITCWGAQTKNSLDYCVTNARISVIPANKKLDTVNLSLVVDPSNSGFNYCQSFIYKQ